MYFYDDNEDEYKREVYAMLDQFNLQTRQRCAIAIRDLFDSEHRISWQFIATALKKKSLENYQTYGFGLWFNNGFIANVFKQMERDDLAKRIDVDEFLEGVIDEQQ